MQILEVEESLIAKKDVPCWFRAVFDMEYVMVHFATESSSEPNLKFQFNLISETFFFFVGLLFYVVFMRASYWRPILRF